jgi:hypothetical protein
MLLSSSPANIRLCEVIDACYRTKACRTIPNVAALATAGCRSEDPEEIAVRVAAASVAQHHLRRVAIKRRAPYKPVATKPRIHLALVVPCLPLSRDLHMQRRLPVAVAGLV